MRDKIEKYKSRSSEGIDQIYGINNPKVSNIQKIISRVTVTCATTGDFHPEKVKEFPKEVTKSHGIVFDKAEFEEILTGQLADQGSVSFGEEGSYARDKPISICVIIGIIQTLPKLPILFPHQLFITSMPPRRFTPRPLLPAHSKKERR